MLQAFIDDSGAGTDGPVFVLSGWIAKENAWTNFSRDWNEILAIGPLPLKYFKMNEAYALRGQFNGWSETRRDERLNMLVDVINRYVDFGVHSIVSHAEYARHFKKKFGKEIDHPAKMLFASIIRTFCRLLNESGHPTDTINFVFDELLTKCCPTPARWNFLKGTIRPEERRFLGPRPVERNDIGVPPLQAADLAAWVTRRTYDESSTGSKFVWKWNQITRPFHSDAWRAYELPQLATMLRAFKS